MPTSTELEQGAEKVKTLIVTLDALVSGLRFLGLTDIANSLESMKKMAQGVHTATDKAAEIAERHETQEKERLAREASALRGEQVTLVEPGVPLPTAGVFVTPAYVPPRAPIVITQPTKLPSPTITLPGVAFARLPTVPRFVAGRPLVPPRIVFTPPPALLAPPKIAATPPPRAGGGVFSRRGYPEHA